MAEVRELLEEVFADVFGRQVELSDETTAADVEDWDSLQHVNLMIAVEERFGIRLATAEISKLKEPGQNIAKFVQLLERKVGAARASR